MQADLLYIEIESVDLPIVQSTLDKMGVVFTEQEFDPELGRGEYLCPRCDYGAKSPGPCPKHRIPLLEFSQWAEIRKGRRAKFANRVLQLVVMFLILMVLWNALKGYN